MYLKSIKFVKSERCFKKSETYDFEDLTLLVGDQGCGKSTLLEGLHKKSGFLKTYLTREGMAGVNTYYFDAERLNPRLRDPQFYTTAGGEDKGIGYTGAIMARFKSHGEVIRSYTVDCLKQAKNCLIFLDEPESGLSLRSQYKCAAEIKNALERDCQLIIATHSLVIIKMAESVLSLEHKRWMPSAEFIASNDF